MRATLRITWLLLSLSSLLPSIYSDVSSTPEVKNSMTTNAPSATSYTTHAGGSDKAVANTAVTHTAVAHTAVADTAVANKTGTDTAVADTAVANKTGTDTAVADNVTEANKPGESTTANIIISVIPSTIPSTVKPESTTVTVKKDQITTSGPPTSLPTITIQPTTVGNGLSSTIAKTDSVTTKIQDVSVTLPGSGGVNSTTMVPGSSLIPTTPVTNQGDSNRGITTVPTTAPGSTPSQDTGPKVTPGITLSTPSQVVAGWTTEKPSDAKAGTSGLPATTAIAIIPPAQLKYFSYSLNNGEESKTEKHLVELCKRLMSDCERGNCTLTYWKPSGRIQFEMVDVNCKAKTNVASQYYEDITKEPTDNKTLIAILASCGALLIMIVILAVCASHHRKPYNENQQHLTEELNTVENGYHDNPTLEVMEVQPEMQEKKMALNGEFNDSWIVPMDNLMKEDIPDEEDTHL